VLWGESCCEETLDFRELFIDLVAVGDSRAGSVQVQVGFSDGFSSAQVSAGNPNEKRIEPKRLIAHDEYHKTGTSTSCAANLELDVQAT